MARSTVGHASDVEVFGVFTTTNIIVVVVEELFLFIGCGEGGDVVAF